MNYDGKQITRTSYGVWGDLWCDVCQVHYFGQHICPGFRQTPRTLTESDIRRIVREELERALKGKP